MWMLIQVAEFKIFKATFKACSFFAASATAEMVLIRHSLRVGTVCPLTASAAAPPLEGVVTVTVFGEGTPPHREAGGGMVLFVKGGQESAALRR